MALKITQVKVWAASIEDKPGGLAAKLDALAKSGANLEMVIARRAPDKPGTGVVFVTPIMGEGQAAVAKGAGFSATESLHSVRVEGPDEPGLGAKITQRLAESGINLRGLSAAAMGGRMICHLALDSGADASRVPALLKGL